MINTKSILSFFTILSLLAATACTEKENNPKVSCSTSQEDLLLNYATQFEKDVNECRLALTDLEASEWQNDSAFASNKPKLIAARLAYNNISSYNFGPAIINGVELNDRLNVFPANESAIKANALAGEQDIESLFKSQVGLEAIEYLVYNLDSIADNQIEKDAVVSHLKALISDAKSRVETMHTAYQNGYISDFKSNTGSDDGSSLALFCNQFVQDIETRLRNNKLRIPVGKFNGGIPLTDKVEGRYSDQGLLFAAQHFLKLSTLFGSSQDSLSLSAYLVCLGENELSQSIEVQILATSQAYTALQNIHGTSLIDAINQTPESVSALIDEHQKLVALLKGPMLSALGVRINYTDSDGD